MARNKYDIDEVLESEFNFSHLKRLIKYMGRYKKTIILAVLVILTGSLLTTLGPIVVKTCVDILAENAGAGIQSAIVVKVTLFMVGYVAIAVVGALSLRIKTRLMSVTGQNIIRDIRYDLFTQIQKLPFSYYDSRPHGKILVRVVNYVNSISDFLSNGVINMITDLFTLLVIMVFMFIMNVRLTLVCLAPLPVFILVLFIIKNRQRIAWHERIYSRKYRRHEGHTVLHAGSAEYEHFPADMRRCEIVMDECEKIRYHHLADD